MSIKNPLTPAGVEPATFRFVAQHLNHCATAVPNLIYMRNFITLNHPGEKSWSNSGRRAKACPQQHRSTWLFALLPVVHRNVRSRKSHTLQAVLPTTPCQFSPSLSDRTFLNTRISSPYNTSRRRREVVQALDGGGWSTPRHGRYARERPGIHCIGGWVGPRADLYG